MLPRCDLCDADERTEALGLLSPSFPGAPECPNEPSILTLVVGPFGRREALGVLLYDYRAIFDDLDEWHCQAAYRGWLSEDTVDKFPNV